MAPIIERIDSGCASNPMRVLIRLTAPITYMTILYERSVLEDKIRDDGRSMKSLEHTMGIMSADSACSNEASRAFIQLGGIRQFIYKFQDGEQFLDISVERC